MFVHVCLSVEVTVFVCIMSELSCLCADDLTNSVRSAVPLSVFGCGWNVCVFSEKSGKITVFLCALCRRFYSMFFYLENQYVQFTGLCMLQECEFISTETVACCLLCMCFCSVVFSHVFCVWHNELGCNCIFLMQAYVA